jgi:aspartyl-tRNA synthetase
LIKNNFFEIQPPCIIASASEGGAELFKLQYFEKQAYLAQSPQLYKQMGAISFGKVFCIMPVFRAEKFNKPTHLNEIRQMDVEIAFVESEEDAMKVLEECFVHILETVKENCKKELEILKREIEIPKLPLKRITYEEAVELLKKEGEEIEYGEDFSKLQEQKLGEIVGKVFFIKEWPTELKAFYAMPFENNPKICRAFDLIYEGLEISSGTQRIHIPELLINQLKSKELNPDDFKFYIDCFRFGAPPHAGWSIGLERITMKICGLNNIQEATMFPRTRTRLTP